MGKISSDSKTKNEREFLIIWHTRFKSKFAFAPITELSCSSQNSRFKSIYALILSILLLDRQSKENWFLHQSSDLRIYKLCIKK